MPTTFLGSTTFLYTKCGQHSAFGTVLQRADSTMDILGGNCKTDVREYRGHSTVSFKGSEINYIEVVETPEEVLQKIKEATNGSVD